MSRKEEKKVIKMIINDYWKDFSDGETWNYFNMPVKYSSKDVWATHEKWIEMASKCLDSEKNELQALEILLHFDFNQYSPKAIEILNEWEQSGGADAYYFYDILACFPKKHPLRKKYLSVASFEKLFLQDSEIGLAREALIRVKDEQFLDAVRQHIASQMNGKNLSSESIENEVLPYIIELGALSSQLVSSSHMDKIKSMCLEYYEKDKVLVESVLNEEDIDEDVRSIWIADDLAYYAWRLGWRDIMDDLFKDELYWSAMFSDWWNDYDNNNLLAWSTHYSNRMLHQRSCFVMGSEEHMNIDGAIAWHRLDVQGSERKA